VRDLDGPNYRFTRITVGGVSMSSKLMIALVATGFIGTVALAEGVVLKKKIKKELTVAEKSQKDVKKQSRMAKLQNNFPEEAAKYKKLLAEGKKADIGTVKRLLKSGADINAKNKYGYTPLYRATSKGHIKIAKILLSKRADINAKADRGYTSLHIATFNGHTEMVKTSLAEGADSHAKAKNGATALTIAVHKKDKEIQKWSKHCSQKERILMQKQKTELLRWQLQYTRKTKKLRKSWLPKKELIS
jgi:Ankyrin repeats (many copies)/Ankyrin repeats (3 copies)